LRSGSFVLLLPSTPPWSQLEEHVFYGSSHSNKIIIDCFFAVVTLIIREIPVVVKRKLQKIRVFGGSRARNASNSTPRLDPRLDSSTMEKGPASRIERRQYPAEGSQRRSHSACSPKRKKRATEETHGGQGVHREVESEGHEEKYRPDERLASSTKSYSQCRRERQAMSG
jgi:hypothetical protein